MKVDIVVKVDGKVARINESHCKNFKLVEEKTNYGTRITGVFTPSEETTFIKAELNLPENYYVDDKIMSNGYQSWTRTSEVDILHKEKKMSLLAKIIEPHYHLSHYGDYFFYNYKNKKGVIHSHKFTYIRRDKKYRIYGAINESTCFTIFETDTKNSLMKVISDVSNFVTTKEITLFDLIITDGTRDEVFDTFFSVMKIEKPKAKKLKGFTSWYNYYQNIDEEIILRNVENFKKLKQTNDVDIFQIDDGYQTFVGDWLEIDEQKFPNGIKSVADKINGNFLSGIWLAPFVCEKKSRIFREHQDWILKDCHNKNLPAGSNWSGFYPLDLYNEEVRDYLRKVFKTVFDVWGFKMVKLDFLYAVCLNVPKDKTRGQVMRESMEFLRELCGDNLILGCGVPLSSAFGLVDYCRIGCDVSLDWDGGFVAKVAHKECVCTRDAMIDSVSRFPLSGRAFLNDPDVFLLRSDNIEMTDSEKYALSVTNSIFGRVLFTSDDFSKYKSEEAFEKLKEIWTLNDCELIDYEIIDKAFFKAKIKTLGEEKCAYINASEDTYICDKYVIGARSCKIA